MTEDKKYYIFGKVHHQDETNAVELLGDAMTTEEASDLISGIMNRNFPPENIFVIEGFKRDVSIKSVIIE
jgi:hypothetical protein